MQHLRLVTTYIPWFGVVIVELFLIGIMLRRKVVQRFPFFFSAILFDVLRTLVLIAIYFGSPKTHLYFYVYWISVPVEYVIAFGVMWEAFRYSLGADPKIPSKALRLMVALTTLLVITSAALVLRPDIPTDNLTGALLTVDRSIELLRCGMLLLMWIFASKLGITWRHHVWGIVFGLGMYSGISLIVAALHATTGTMCGDWLARIPPFSYLAATMIWTVYLWRPEPERGPLTLNELSLINYLLGSYRKALAEIRRLWLNGNPD